MIPKMDLSVGEWELYFVAPDNDLVSDPGPMRPLVYAIVGQIKV